MVHANANEEVKSFLTSLKVRSEIRDESGTILGYFEPASIDEAELYRRAAALFTDEDVRRALAAEGPWSTTDEMLDRFRSLVEA